MVKKQADRKEACTSGRLWRWSGKHQIIPGRQSCLRCNYLQKILPWPQLWRRRPSASYTILGHSPGIFQVYLSVSQTRVRAPRKQPWPPAHQRHPQRRHQPHCVRWFSGIGGVNEEINKRMNGRLNTRRARCQELQSRNWLRLEQMGFLERQGGDRGSSLQTGGGTNLAPLWAGA